MQPTERQVQATLEALQDEPTSALATSTIPRDTLEFVLRDLPDGLLEELEEGPAVRPDRMAEVRGRLEHGDKPSDDELANRIVGRLVCDRLR